jgi:hypothetical protein
MKDHPAKRPFRHGPPEKKEALEGIVFEGQTQENAEPEWRMIRKTEQFQTNTKQVC